MTIWAFHFWYIDNYRECIEIKINLLFAGDVDIYRLSYSIFIPANTIDQIKPCIYIYCIFKYIVYIKKFNGKTDVNESEIIFPRNYNKWIDGTIFFIISIKKEKKRKFNQDKISLIISNIYSIYIYIYSTWITSDQHMNSNKFTGTDYHAVYPRIGCSIDSLFS